MTVTEQTPLPLSPDGELIELTTGKGGGQAGVKSTHSYPQLLL